MKWFYLMSLDPWLETEVFFQDDASGRRILRPCYQQLACPKCGKFDEVQALQTGLPEGFQADLDNGRDIQATLDSVNVVSPRLRTILEELGVGGVQFSRCSPRGDSVIVPIIVAKTDASRSKMDFRGRKPCSVCGRYSITCFFPTVEAMEFPEQTPAICTSGLRAELKSHSSLALLVSQDVVETLRRHRIRGADIRSGCGGILQD